MQTPKPYFDSIQVRSALLRLIERMIDKNEFPDEDIVSKSRAMYSFYRNPAPVGKEYIVRDVEWIATDEFMNLYSRLEELLLVKIPRSRSAKSLKKYSNESITIATKLWEKFYVVGETPSGEYYVTTKDYG